ncbi:MULTISPECIES: hypothetical protein [Comamonadaceae]|jgi:hypothetical protein|uniref:hypothetical protein n=1 Tax=Comamonadaceae TaxID=80864 RepID=UPI002724CE79|nr:MULTISPECIES: hypothetical protein [Comamonadaceae]MDZ4356755.1 hypothetical protein [Variovorax sp.]MDO9252850.1 hypothetical protein [Hydrogenophaga sp.]MDP2440417.1 hypothetical protein [Rhodoferax sp.]MDP3323596.1 hypothetical protein [Hydrogenophaga sp.]MDP3886164.1 hypothetical protein [Hydrogenophaga sp.]
MSILSHSMARGLLASAALLMLSPAAFAQSRSAIDAAYQQDRAACLDSASMHERSACLREAGAVRAEALKGRRLAGTSADTLARNAVQRCQELPPDDKLLCERRVRGEGNETGSVAAGGVLRELVTEVPAPAPMAAPR